MQRTILTFVLVGPAIAGLPIYGFNLHAIPFAWLVGVIPMAAAGIAHHFLAERVLQLHAATFPASVRQRISFAVLIGTLVGAFAAYAMSAVAVTSIAPVDALLAALVTGGHAFVAAVIGLGRLVYLLPKTAVAMGAAAGAASAMACMLMEARWLAAANGSTEANGETPMAGAPAARL